MLIPFEAMRYGERLKLAMDHANLKQYQLAEKAGIQQPSLSYLLNKEKVTGSEFTVQLALACGVRPEWLALEEGEMVETPRDEILEMIKRNNELVRLLRAAEPLGKYEIDVLVSTSTALAGPHNHNNTK